MTTIRIWWINNRLRAVSVAIWRDWFNPADGHSSTIVPVLWSIQLLICIRSPDAVRVILRFLHSNRISLEEAFVTRSEKSSGRRRQSAPICISTLSELFKFLSKFWKIVFYYLSHDDWYERCGVGSLAPKLWIKTRRWRPQPQICILRLWRTWICISKKKNFVGSCWLLAPRLMDFESIQIQTLFSAVSIFRCWSLAPFASIIAGYLPPFQVISPS